MLSGGVIGRLRRSLECVLARRTGPGDEPTVAHIAYRRPGSVRQRVTSEHGMAVVEFALVATMLVALVLLVIGVAVLV
jgi:hypothetical protein